MRPESKDQIIKNFVILMKQCDVNVIRQSLINNAIFSEREIKKIFSTNDARHNKRIFFFELQKKEQRAFTVFLDALRVTNQKYIADLLHRKGATVFAQACEDQETGTETCRVLSLPTHRNESINRLKIEVRPSAKFLDTYTHHGGLEYYYTRSKKRGRALIINNYEFSCKDYRNGATVDSENLKDLFAQMGGWDFHLHRNKTAEEMNILIHDFSQDQINKQYDICFVAIMSHGSEITNETIIYGIDGKYIHESKILQQFNNSNCKYFISKPKVFVFQICRGADLDIAYARHVTETDSMAHQSSTQQSSSQHSTLHTPIRTQEDMLVGYSTLQGYKAHRDPFRGSWYIEILCEKIMNFAHDTPFDDVLTLTDQTLRRRMSENNTMQTAEHRNLGFKKLYLHPGIYAEDEAVKRYFY